MNRIMRKNRIEKKLLLGILILNLGIILPIIYRKSPIKDWIIVYLFNAVTNGIIDNALTKNLFGPFTLLDTYF
jgi:hypothetical protein